MLLKSVFKLILSLLVELLVLGLNNYIPNILRPHIYISIILRFLVANESPCKISTSVIRPLYLLVY